MSVSDMVLPMSQIWQKGRNGKLMLIVEIETLPFPRS